MDIRGENFQEIADIYIGCPDDFQFNPRIACQTGKQMDIHTIGVIDGKYNNPSIVFLYPHRLQLFSEKIGYFMNPFSLITHNSDFNLENHFSFIREILENPLLISWYGQNLCFIHPKIRFLPIGFANSMWEHGKIDYLPLLNTEKTNDIFLNFNIYTNVEERTECYNAMEFRVEHLPMVSARENIERLSKYKWCICPQGNGVDTHRLWEALALKTIPIVRRTPFIETLMWHTNNELPIHILENWWEALELPEYNSNVFDKCKKWLSVDWYRNKIMSNT